MKQIQAALLAAAMALSVTGCSMPWGQAGATPAPTASPMAAPSPTPEPTPEPTPVPTPGVNPLTGLADPEGALAGKRPVAVQIRTGDGTLPQWGIASADVLVAGVTEGHTAGLMAIFSSADQVSKAGPVAPGRDLMLQFALPLNAVPVHIDKNVYAYNLLNLLSYQDVDGFHTGTAAFAFDSGRQDSGYREENCWYTTGDLIRAGMDLYGASTDGETIQLFDFGERADPASRNGTELHITFDEGDTESFYYSAGDGVYFKTNADGGQSMDADVGRQASFTNLFVLYASSGIKDDGYTRQYDLTGGAGLYLTDGAWQEIRWQKGDATAPLVLTDLEGGSLTVNPGKSYIAVWGGYYGQGLRVVAEDGSEQTLPAKPALLESGVSDEAAAQSEQEYDAYQNELAAALATPTPAPADGGEAAQGDAAAEAAE
ncbi:MAG TPA: DUF3048 domain-containing protein [Candidatus Gemmiger faecigallinarum]|nr:DUF3048 domain-containing protein [Candidatus Gemmiger faecigallinarum]